ncbi:MAG: hypothetical protein L6R48_10900 [Planctomycetes bacterium]|nr:hypothetical protein [Planctomycetota bacterium]
MPRRNKAKEYAATKAARAKAVEEAVVSAKVELATKLQKIAAKAADQLERCVDQKGPVTINGSLDSAYVTALRLALQAGGVLSEKVDHTTNGKDLPAVVNVMTMPPKDP